MFEGRKSCRTKEEVNDSTASLHAQRTDLQGDKRPKHRFARRQKGRSALEELAGTYVQGKSWTPKARRDICVRQNLDQGPMRKISKIFGSFLNLCVYQTSPKREPISHKIVYKLVAATLL